MHIPSTAQQPGKAALRSGAMIGIALGIIHSVITIILTQMNAASLNTTDGGAGMPTITIILYLLTPLIWIIGFLITGAWASRETGKISAGVLAGLFAGTFGGIIAGIGQVIATAIANSQQGYTSSNSSLLLFSGFAAVFYVMILALGAGAGFGVLGGLIGQSMSNVRPQPAVQPVYAQPAVQPVYAQPAVQPVYAQPAVPYTYVPAQPPAVPPQTPQVPPLTQLPEQ
jgi:hypothetical protein